MPATATERMSLDAFYAYMDAQRGRPDIDELRHQLQKLDVPFNDVAHVARFAPEGYQRNLLHEGARWHALILCWSPGQRSPIHDHAHSVCGVKVIRGVATETLFSRTPSGQLKALSSSDLHEGAVCASRDADIHQVSNLQAPGSDLVTLHVYAPPLREMKQYSMSDGRGRAFVDPVVGFVDGGGI